MEVKIKKLTPRFYKDFKLLAANRLVKFTPEEEI